MTTPKILSLIAVILAAVSLIAPTPYILPIAVILIGVAAFTK